MRVTADTNIYVSALNYSGPPAAFLRLAAEGEIRLAISEAILGEIAATLRRKFHWPDDRIAQAHQVLGSMTERVVPSVVLDVVKEDPDDNRILECAQSAHSQCVVTRDKDLLRLVRYDGMPILTVTEFLTLFAAAAPRGTPENRPMRDT